jgi:hypothetical protein
MNIDIILIHYKLFTGILIIIGIFSAYLVKPKKQFNKDNNDSNIDYNNICDRNICDSNICDSNIGDSNIGDKKIRKCQYQFKIKKYKNKKIDIKHTVFIISQILIELYEKNKNTQNAKIDNLLDNRKITLNDCNDYYTICRSDILSILNIILEKNI